MALVVCQLYVRNDSAANWTSSNPTLALGELGYESDTKQYKWGDGSTAWTSLSYHSLDDIFDIVITSISDNEVLAYNSGSSKWINQTPAEAGLISTAGGQSIAGTLEITGAVTVGSTVDGRDLVIDGDKLDLIEASAKDDQTAAEIEAIVSHDNLVDFTVNEHFLQSAISITESQISDLSTNKATTAQLADIANAINTAAAKVLGYAVLNTTTGVTVFAAGDADDSVWHFYDSTTAHTPVA